MPSGVYERKPKTKRSANRTASASTYDSLLAQLRAERERLVDKVTALGTAIEALEALA